MKKHSLFLTFLVIITFCKAQSVTRLTDTENTQDATNVSSFVSTKTGYYFAANTKQYGNELWFTNKTTSGTQLKIEKNNGPLSSISNFPSSKIKLGTKYFYFTTQSSKIFLNTIDTVNNTVEEIYAFNTSNLSYTQPTVVGDRLFFTDEGSIYVTDGTKAGTKFIKDVTNTGTGPTFNIAALNNTLYTIANFSEGIELGKIVNDKVTLAIDINPGSGWGFARETGVSGSNFANKMVATNSHLFFTATKDGLDYDFYSYDGTTLLKVLELNGGFINEEFAISVNGNKVYFMTGENGASAVGNTPYRVYVSDGTVAGTQVLTAPSALVNGYNSTSFIHQNDIYFTTTSSFKTQLFSLNTTTNKFNAVSSDFKYSGSIVSFQDTLRFSQGNKIYSITSAANGIKPFSTIENISDVSLRAIDNQQLVYIGNYQEVVSGLYTSNLNGKNTQLIKDFETYESNNQFTYLFDDELVLKIDNNVLKTYNLSTKQEKVLDTLDSYTSINSHELSAFGNVIVIEDSIYYVKYKIDTSDIYNPQRISVLKSISKNGGIPKEVYLSTPNNDIQNSVATDSESIVLNAGYESMIYNSKTGKIKKITNLRFYPSGKITAVNKLLFIVDQSNYSIDTLSEKGLSVGRLYNNFSQFETKADTTFDLIINGQMYLNEGMYLRFNFTKNAFDTLLSGVANVGKMMATNEFVYYYGHPYGNSYPTPPDSLRKISIKTGKVTTVSVGQGIVSTFAGISDYWILNGEIVFMSNKMLYSLNVKTDAITKVSDLTGYQLNYAIATKNELVFDIDDLSTIGAELYSYYPDGNYELNLIKDINPLYGSFPVIVGQKNDYLYFSAYEPIYGRELYKYEYQPKIITSTFDYSASQEGLFFYPNPVVSDITIEKGVENVEVSDLSGRFLFTIKVVDSTADLSELKKGLYLLTGTTTEGKRVTSKLFKN